MGLLDTTMPGESKDREADTTGIAPSCRRPRALVIVAHPDDETLWSGGTILMHPGWTWTVAVASRASDPDRAPRFARAMVQLATTGKMADVDDGPEQTPLKDAIVMEAIAGLVTPQEYDLVLTHGPDGEYTRHRRHEEVSRAVRTLWSTGAVAAGELWLFAYEDGGGSHLPRAALAALVRPACDRKLEFGFNEWLRAQDGTVRGQDWQTWSAAMYLHAVECVERGCTPFLDEVRRRARRATTAAIPRRTRTPGL